MLDRLIGAVVIMHSGLYVSRTSHTLQMMTLCCLSQHRSILNLHYVCIIQFETTNKQTNKKQIHRVGMKPLVLWRSVNDDKLLSRHDWDMVIVVPVVSSPVVLHCTLMWNCYRFYKIKQTETYIYISANNTKVHDETSRKVDNNLDAMIRSFVSFLVYVPSCGPFSLLSISLDSCVSFCH